MKILAPFVSISYQHCVTEHDFPSFNKATVHQVYSTYALARDAEWTGRLVLLPLLETGEEGIGTNVIVQHKAPAFKGEIVVFATTQHLLLNPNTLEVHMQALVGNRLIAEIITVQKVVQIDWLKEAWARINPN